MLLIGYLMLGSIYGYPFLALGLLLALLLIALTYHTRRRTATPAHL